MALQKTIQLRTGVSGSYMRIDEIRWNRSVREATVCLALYRDAVAAADPACLPLLPQVVRCVVSGDSFTKFFGAAIVQPGATMQGQAYAAILATDPKQPLNPLVIAPSDGLGISNAQNA